MGNAKEPEIEITPAMIEAGDDALFSCQDEVFSCCPEPARERLLRLVYLAMSRAAAVRHA